MYFSLANVLDNYPFVVDIPNSKWHGLKPSTQSAMLQYDSLDQVCSIYIEKSYGIIQSSDGI